MGTEIERKFLVRGDAWREGPPGAVYRQGYLSTEVNHAVRVRVIGERALLTIKSRQTDLTRLEFEYPIPLADAQVMLDQICAQPLIEKRRYIRRHGGLTWEIDEFFGANRGLVIAELELGSEDQPFDLPDWVGAEVSDDPRYLNASLVRHPYSEWGGRG